MFKREQWLLKSGERAITAFSFLEYFYKVSVKKFLLIDHLVTHCYTTGKALLFFTYISTALKKKT